MFYYVRIFIHGASIALSITLLVKLPLSNAIDDAANHLYIIYQASVTFFAALIAFQVLFRQPNSAFDVYIKAIDGHVEKSDEIVASSPVSRKTGKEANEIELQNLADDKIKTWIELSDREKETLLAKVALTYLTKALDPNVKFIGTELGQMFPSETTLPNDSDNSSAHSDVGGHSSSAKKEEEKKVIENQPGDGTGSSAKPSSSADHHLGHSSKDEKGDSTLSGSSQSNCNTGGCFSCCSCWRRDNRESLLGGEETLEPEQQDNGSSMPPSSADGHSSKQGDSSLSNSSQSNTGGAWFSCCPCCNRKRLGQSAI